MSPQGRLAAASVAALLSSALVVSLVDGLGSSSGALAADHGGGSVIGTAADARAVTRESIAAGILPRQRTSTPAWHGYRHKPNVLMITADDLSVADLPYMPHVRRLLGRQGVDFTNAVAPTPICVPARASLLTGQYAHNHKDVTIHGPRGGYAAMNEAGTLPIALQRAGYDTLFVGKYLNGYGDAGTAHQVPPGWTDWRATVGNSTYAFFSPRINHNGRLTTYHRYTTYVMRDQADEVLSAPRRQHHRWFMWLNYVAPHHGGPREADDPAVRFRGTPLASVRTTVPAPRDRHKFANLTLPDKPYLFGIPAHDEPGTAARTHAGTSRLRKALRIAFRQRVQAAQALDRAVASQIGTLRRTHQLKHTIVIFGSDNGYTVGGHNVNGKLWGYDEILRIPLLMRGPGIPRGKKVATTITNPDLATTILAATGATPLRRQDGVNMLPWLRSPTQQRVIPIEGWAVASGRRQVYHGIRAGHWTYLRYRDGSEELFNRANDPDEMDSLASEPAHRAQLMAMRALSRAYGRCAGASCPKSFYR
ncbi:MAG: sulfatase-like hydrolase/transferase [Nocardioides sp.]|uniref:sulfatase-like hydrolase/transferase n=1 Tax=Nocardioides sp. TaxID=35761 RepID=UPI0039E703DF